MNDSDFHSISLNSGSEDKNLTHFRVLEKKNHLQNDLRSCCGGTSDRRLVLMIAQISFSAILLVFCGTVLLVGHPGEDKAVYFSLISSIISFWFGNQISMEKR